MSDNNAILAPECTMHAIPTSILRGCLFTTRTSMGKFSAAFQNHALVKIFIAILLPGVKWDVLLALFSESIPVKLKQ